MVEHGDADIVPSGKNIRQPGMGQWSRAAPGLLRLSEGDQRLAAALICGREHMVPFLTARIEHGKAGFDEADHRRHPGRWIWMVDHGWFPRLLRDGLRMTNRVLEFRRDADDLLLARRISLFFFPDFSLF